MDSESDDDDCVVVEAKKEDMNIIETGDMVKVEQVLDDAIYEAIDELSLKRNMSSEYMKVAIMASSCVFASVAQFFPIPFPDNRPLLAVCVAGYFILSGILQYYVMFVEDDILCRTQVSTEQSTGALRVRSKFPRFQEYYEVSFENDDLPADQTTKTSAKLYVGRYFTARGEFYEEGFINDVKTLLTHYKDNSHKQYVFDAVSAKKKKN